MDKQLRLPVFVMALIIVSGIGIPPCKATAGECYNCTEPECDTKKSSLKCDLDACKTTFNTDKVATRSCSETPNKAECALEFFENGCVDEEYDYFEGSGTVLDNCTSGVETKRAAGVELIKGMETHKTCYCKGKLCNNKAIRAPASCYNCEEPQCEGQTSYCKFDACTTIYFAHDKDLIRRGCSKQKYFAECALEFYENGCVGDDTEDLDKCANGIKTKRDPGEELIKARKDKDKKTVCYCKGKDCNKGKGVTLSVNIQLVFCLSVLATRSVWVINKE